MRWTRWLGLVVLVGIIAIGWVRLAPSDPERWHEMPQTLQNQDLAGGAIRLAELGPDGLARLDTVIRATPRTSVLAGSVQSGMITYVTRTKVVGFPDYTTIRQSGDRIEIYGRLRYGISDLGVNAARIDGWLNALGAQVLGQGRRQAPVRNLAPHRYVERHLALGHEHFAIDMQAGHFAQFHPRAGLVGAIAIHGLAADGGIGQRG